MHMKINIRLSTLSLIGLCAVTASPVYAECKWSSDNNKKGEIDFSYTAQVYPPGTSTGYITSGTRVLYSADIASSMGATSASEVLVRCDGGETIQFERVDGGGEGRKPITSTPGFYYSFPSSGSGGTGIFQGTSSYTIDSSGDINTNFLTTVSNSGSANLATLWQRTPAEISSYVTGHIERQLVGTVRTSDGLELLDVYMGEWVFYVSTCELSGYDSEVSLGNFSQTGFRAVDSITNAARFNINMACYTGLTPSVTFTAPTVDNYPDVLENNGDAEGVGLKLFYVYNGLNPITPGSAFNLGTRTHSGFSDYTFSTALYQLQNVVTAGTLDFTATFTVEYE